MLKWLSTARNSHRTVEKIFKGEKAVKCTHLFIMCHVKTSLENYNNVHLSYAHPHLERSHDTY